MFLFGQGSLRVQLLPMANFEPLSIAYLSSVSVYTSSFVEKTLS